MTDVELMNIKSEEEQAKKFVELGRFDLAWQVTMSFWKSRNVLYGEALKVKGTPAFDEKWNLYLEMAERSNIFHEIIEAGKEKYNKSV